MEKKKEVQMQPLYKLECEGSLVIGERIKKIHDKFSLLPQDYGFQFGLQLWM